MQFGTFSSYLLQGRHKSHGSQPKFSRENRPETRHLSKVLFWERSPRNRRGRLQRIKQKIKALTPQYILGSIQLDPHRICAECAPEHLSYTHPTPVQSSQRGQVAYGLTCLHIWACRTQCLLGASLLSWLQHQRSPRSESDKVRMQLKQVPSDDIWG